MVLRTSTKQITVLLAALNVIGLIVCGYAFRELQERNYAISKINKEVEAYAATDANLQALRDALKEAETEVALVDSFYVAPDGAVDFIESVESLARKNGLSPVVESVDSQDVSKETKAFQERIRIRLETTGAWDDTYNFMLLMSNLPYRVTFSGVSLVRLETPNGGAAAGPVWKGDFEISALKLK